MSEYVRAAQRSGLHVVISPSEDGIHVYSCGIALDEVSGKLARYTKDEVVEEVTDMMEALSFEDRFIKGLLKRFPMARTVE